MSLKTEKTCSAELAVVITLPIFIQMSLNIHCYDVNLSVEIKSKLKRVGQRHSFPSDYRMLLSDSILFFISSVMESKARSANSHAFSTKPQQEKGEKYRLIQIFTFLLSKYF